MIGLKLEINKFSLLKTAECQQQYKPADIYWPADEYRLSVDELDQIVLMMEQFGSDEQYNKDNAQEQRDITAQRFD